MSKPLNDDDEVMCFCSGTTRGDIERLFREGLSQDAISRRTGALSGCAGCEWDVAELLKQLAEQNPKPE
jgi:bacterioferritin-associated ferredoxin